MGAQRSQPAGAADHHAGDGKHAGATGASALGCHRAFQRQGFVELGKRQRGGPAKWTVGNGYFATVPDTGDIRTKDAYGDCQLHVEWATPNPPHGTDQDRGNSGVFLHGLYEIQVLDSYDNVTYADGEAAAVYGQYPPLVNAARKPGEWQMYDIVFHGARFDANGNLTRQGECHRVL